MRPIILHVVVFTVFFSAKSLQASDIAQKEHALAEKVVWGQELLFHRKYDEAKELFQTMQKEHPHSAAGFFGEMATLEVRMLEREDFHLDRELEDVARRAEPAISWIMQRYAPTPVELMFCGSLYGLQGFARARQGKWLSAYFLGTKSRQIFRRILERDPTFVDAWFGQGMYLYWRSVFADQLNFLPFISDERQTGIRLVEKVARNGWLAKELARVNLGIIYFEEKRYQDAEKILRDYLQTYPENIVLRMIRGRVFLADKKFDRALEEFRQVLVVEPTHDKAHYFVAVSLVGKKEKELLPEARQALEKFLALKPNVRWQSFAYYWLGRIAEEEGEKKRAQEAYEKAFALNRDLKGAKLRLRALGSGF